MLRTRRTAVAGVTFLCSFAALTGSASATFGSSGDRVVGVGTNSATTIAGFVLDARSGPSGESPYGLGGFATAKDVYNAGAIQCLRVSGNTATMVYKVKWSKGIDPRFDAVRVYVQDNGAPTKWWQPVDRVRNTLFDSSLFPQFLSCPDPAAQSTTDFLNQASPLSSGDTVVKDAS